MSKAKWVKQYVVKHGYVRTGEWEWRGDRVAQGWVRACDWDVQFEVDITPRTRIPHSEWMYWSGLDIQDREA